MPRSLERAVQSFSSLHQTAGSHGASQTLLLWHKLLLLRFLFPWPYKYFLFAEWHHGIGLWLVQLQWKVRPFFFKNWKLAGVKKYPVGRYWQQSFRLPYTPFLMSSFSPPPLLVLDFSCGWRTPSSCQVGSGHDSARTHYCVFFSVCISYCLVPVTMTADVCSLTFEYPSSCMQWPYAYGCRKCRHNCVDDEVSLWRMRQAGGRQDELNEYICQRVALRHWFIVWTSRPEEGTKHAALITIFINQLVSEADSLFINSFTAVSCLLVAQKLTANYTIMSVQTAVMVLDTCWNVYNFQQTCRVCAALLYSLYT